MRWQRCWRDAEWELTMLRPGEDWRRSVARRPRALFVPGKGWEMPVDLGKQLVFPAEITQTTLRPDVRMWLVAAKRFLIIELTVPWEEGIPAAHELKRMKYSPLAVKCGDTRWAATIHPVEVGCRGFVGRSVIHLLRPAGSTGQNLQKAIKEVAEEGQHMGSNTPVGTAAGGGRETSPLPLPPHQEIYWTGDKTSMSGGSSWRPCS